MTYATKGKRGNRMKFLVVDDEAMALKNVKEAIYKAVPDCEIEAFNSASKALDFFPNIQGGGYTDD